MKKKSILFAGVLAVASQGAFASLPPANEISGDVQQLTSEQEQKAIATLLDEGIIEWVDGHFVVRDQTALEKLRQRGRVDLQLAADHVVCY